MAWSNPTGLRLVASSCFLFFAPDGWAGEIDALVKSHCDRSGIAVPERADDATFLRRAYLDAVGRIPTVGEARVFFDSRKPDKRAQLVDFLLGSPGYEKSRLGNESSFGRGRNPIFSYSWIIRAGAADSCSLLHEFPRMVHEWTRIEIDPRLALLGVSFFGPVSPVVSDPGWWVQTL